MKIQETITENKFQMEELDYQYQKFVEEHTDCFGIFNDPTPQPEFDGVAGVIKSTKYGIVKFKGSKNGMNHIKLISENYLYNEWRDCFYHSSFTKN